MATTVNKQRLLTQLLGCAKKAGPESRNGAEGETQPRGVLEEFIFGLCRENATREQAERAFHNLRTRFFDWNEIRVSSIREVEEAFEDAPDAEGKAQRLISFLQEVFEIHFSFDLDKLQKEGLKQAARKLARYQAADDYVSAWVIQRSLGGHAIPLDPAMLRCSLRLGLLDGNHDDLESARSSLEHLVPKAKGPQFTDALAAVAVEFCLDEEPNCSGCPMCSECPSAQDRGVTPASSRPGRGKPR
jgi:endonuclease III